MTNDGSKGPHISAPEVFKNKQKKNIHPLTRTGRWSSSPDDTLLTAAVAPLRLNAEGH